MNGKADGINHETPLIKWGSERGKNAHRLLFGWAVRIDGHERENTKSPPCT